MLLILSAWKTHIRLWTFSKISIIHLIAMGPLIQLLLGFKEPESCSSGKPKKSLHWGWWIELNFRDCSTQLKNLSTFYVKRPLPECLDCMKWWMDQVIFLTWLRKCRAAGQCQGQCFQGAFCVQPVPHPALFVLPEHFLLTVETHP